MHELALCSVEHDGRTVLSGYVRTYDDGVLWAGTEGIVRGVAEGEHYTLRVLDEVRGECVYVGAVARITADTVAFAGVELLSTLQKRAVARVAVSVECEGFATPAGTPHDEGATPAGDGAPGSGERPVQFTVLDVSAHGMRMMSQTELPPGSTVRFVFPELSDAFWLQAVVVRAQPSRSGTHYGCRFVETSPRETDALFRYVLRTQGAQRRQQTLA
ncbi:MULTISPECIES: PilZ domain-containing protein [unclassified Cellulomonas]|uniref:PilZ domain-containing protein n=1 Tax=unclassified Cellulomonas TaxID=2620175 RepID=UPI0019A4C923|nr:PilZ domain-containing protein [Cellulomonas sp. ES6]MBD3778396.1 PilZ domain-containing protein [Micrococcales bacterium]WHP16885.1 PilZ domain-containing protein [Cellulomonas sp. ES6]